jgi:hypothetical protein
VYACASPPALEPPTALTQSFLTSLEDSIKAR